MPVVGLTDHRLASYPQIGQLRKGAARTADDVARRRPGKDLLGFRFTTEDVDTAERFAEVYGEEPLRIDVYLLGHTADDVFSSWAEEWRAGGLIHRCDGVTCVTWQEGGAYHSAGACRCGKVHEARPCPGPTMGPNQKGEMVVLSKCKPVMRLKVMLRDLRRAGYVLVQSTSIHDIRHIHEQLLALEEAGRGDLMGIPMVLSRSPHQVSVPGANGRTRTMKSLMAIEASPTWVDLRMQELEAGARPVVPEIAATSVEHSDKAVVQEGQVREVIETGPARSMADAEDTAPHEDFGEQPDDDDEDDEPIEAEYKVAESGAVVNTKTGEVVMEPTRGAANHGAAAMPPQVEAKAESGAGSALGASVVHGATGPTGGSTSKPRTPMEAPLGRVPVEGAAIDPVSTAVPATDWVAFNSLVVEAASAGVDIQPFVAKVSEPSKVTYAELKLTFEDLKAAKEALGKTA